MFDDGGEHNESHIGPDGEEIVQEREEGRSTRTRIPGTSVAQSLSDAPSKVYFHQRTLLPSGEAPSPWGYWSLEPDFVPGPWPLLSIPAVELTCRYVKVDVIQALAKQKERVRSNYARVSTFEAEVLVYMNRLRRSHAFFEDHLNTAGHIEEVQA